MRNNQSLSSSEVVWMEEKKKMFRGLFLIFYLVGFVLCFDCGVKKVQKSMKLAVGNGTEESYHGQWPWLVSLFASINGTERFFCGATIINNLTLLSG